MRKLGIVPLALLPLAVMLTACKDEKNTTQVINDYNSRKSVDVVGQLVDVSTLKALGNAQVSVLVDGNKTLPATLDASGPTTGRFVVKDVPEGGHKIMIQAEGYAPIEADISLPNFMATFDATGSGKQTNLGQIGLSRPTSLKAKVSTAGRPLAGVTVQAKILGVNENCGAELNAQVISADFTLVTDANGDVNFNVLSQCGVYRLIVPAFDENGDGKYDYETLISGEGYYNARSRNDYGYSANNGIDPRGYPNGLGLSVKKLDLKTALAVTYNSLAGNIISGHPRISDLQSSIYFNAPSWTSAANEPIVLAFNTQATVTDDISVVKLDYAPATGNAVQEVPVAATVAWSLDNTVLTITPPEGGLQQNRFYRIKGSLQATGNQGNGSVLNLNQELYVSKAGSPVSLGARRGANPWGHSSLFFSEHVSGWIKVKSINGSPSAITVSDRGGSFNNSVGLSCAGCDGIVDDYSLNTQLNYGDTIVVEFNVRDLEGNLLKGERSLTIQ